MRMFHSHENGEEMTEDINILKIIANKISNNSEVNFVAVQNTNMKWM